MAYLELSMFIGGFCLMVGAGAFLVRMWIRVARRTDRQDLQGGRLDLYMLCVWSGLLLVQFANILQHVQFDGTYRLSSLTLAATAAVVFVCGICAGRLLLRAELRRYEGRRDELDRAAGP